MHESAPRRGRFSLVHLSQYWLTTTQTSCLIIFHITTLCWRAFSGECQKLNLGPPACQTRALLHGAIAVPCRDSTHGDLAIHRYLVPCESGKASPFPPKAEDASAAQRKASAGRVAVTGLATISWPSPSTWKKRKTQEQQLLKPAILERLLLYHMFQHKLERATSVRVYAKYGQLYAIIQGKESLPL